jgi:hypothetical protein
MEIVRGQSDLPQVVRTLRAACRLASALHRRQQQRDQNADNADHHQQFDKGKAPARTKAIGEEIRTKHATPQQTVLLVPDFLFSCEHFRSTDCQSALLWLRPEATLVYVRRS